MPLPPQARRRGSPGYAGGETLIDWEILPRFSFQGAAPGSRSCGIAFWIAKFRGICYTESMDK